MSANAFEYVSLFIGAVAVISVCIVFIKNHQFEKAGFGLLFCGTVLIGMPVWRISSINWDQQGFNVKFVNTIKQQINDIDAEVKQLSASGHALKVGIEQLSESVQEVHTSNKMTWATLMQNTNKDTTNMWRPYLNEENQKLIGTEAWKQNGAVLMLQDYDQIMKKWSQDLSGKAINADQKQE